MTIKPRAVGMGVFCLNNVQSCCIGCICCVRHSKFFSASSHPTKHICPHCLMYLFELKNVFVQIAKCICQNCKGLKVVVLAAFGVVDTANLSPLLLIQQNALFLLKLNNYFAQTNICVETDTNLEALEFLKQYPI